MLDKNSDVSRLLDRLVLKKLVTKNQCPKDKRAVDVLITEPGLALLKKIDGKMDKNDLAVFHLTKTEATQLSDLLDKCRG